MTEEKVTPLRARMIEDMRIKGLGEKAQKSHIRAVRELAAFLKRSPNTATLEDLRAYQLHLTNAGTSPSAFNSRINGLRVSRTFAVPLARRFLPTLWHDLSQGRFAGCN